jgi:hypothetical protein
MADEVFNPQAWLGPEAFPLEYSAESAFLNAAGVPSGAVGARAVLSFELNNWPHVAYGIRLVNVYALPSTPDALDLDTYRTCKEWLDDDQLVSINLARQNITTNTGVHQRTLQGRVGLHWHPFPKPYLFRGANNCSVEVTRLVDYPTIGDAPVLPVLRGTLITAVSVAEVGGISRRAPGSSGRPQ